MLNLIRFDARPRRFLGRMALASSALDSASALRDSGPRSMAGSSVPFIAIILLAFIVTGVGGGGFILARRWQSRPNISAASLSLGADGSVTDKRLVTDTRWPVEGSRPTLSHHAELVALEPAQREASWARRGGRLTAQFDPRTHRQLPTLVSDQGLSIRIPPRQSIVELVLQPSLNASAFVRPAASSHQQVFIFSLSKSTTDQTAGLSAERVFDNHLLEKYCLLAEADKRELMNTTPALACERCCAESVLDCLCGCQCRSSFAQHMSAGRQLCDYCVKLKASKDCAARRAQHNTAMKLILQNFSDAIHEKLQQLPDREVSGLPLHRIHEFLRRKPFRAMGCLSLHGMDRAAMCQAAILSMATSVVKPSLSSKRYAAVIQAVPRRQVIIVRHGTSAHAIHSLEELSTLKQQAKHIASEATGLSSLRINLILNGKPVHDEGAIFDRSGTFSSFDTYTLQVALLGGSGNGADEDPRAKKRKERRAALLKKETEEERRIRLDKRKMNDKKRREKEDDTARQARQAADKASHAKARAGEGEEAKKARQASNKASLAKARAGEGEDVT